MYLYFYNNVFIYYVFNVMKESNIKVEFSNGKGYE